jgi:hypothetical protein
MESRNLTLPVKNNFKTQPSVGKVMTLFWDAQGPIFEHHEERGTTVNCVIIVKFFGTN